MVMSAAEQYLLELINRARLDPMAEAQRYGVALNTGLRPGTIDGTSKQVLSPNDRLETAAQRHSDWMLRADVFSHTGAGGSSPGERMAAAGYTFGRDWTWRENLAWTGTTGDLSLARAIEQHHAGLYRSAGHRENTFADDVREVGVAQVAGKFSYQGNTYNASMLTQQFARNGDDVFVTGVTYQDRDGNGMYSIGEARVAYWLRGGADSVAVAPAGGYGLNVGNADTVDVQIGTGRTVLAELTVDTSDGNAKLDVVEDAHGVRSVYLSASADLGSGITQARLLGRDNLDLSGTDSNDVLTGNSGRNAIAGENGNDRIHGGANRDQLTGGGGNDRIFGESGSDWMHGENGNDVLYGGHGWDRITGGGGNDQIWGGRDGDRISGNDGRDVLFGNEGNDRIWGGNQWDRIDGGDGNDRIDGGFGNDWLTGGAGADTFLFKFGRDRILDFENDIDTIALSRVTCGVTSVADAMSHASIIDGDAVFDFGRGRVLTVEGVDDLNILFNDLTLI